MKIKLLKMTLVGLFFVSGFAKAGLIYDFVCDIPACGSQNIWVGSFEFDDNRQQVLGFEFTTSTFGAPNIFSLDGLSETSVINVEFTDDKKFINVISGDHGYSTVLFRDGSFGLYVSANSVLLSNGNSTFGPAGKWELREVPEPSTLAISLLGIIVLVSRRFKKRS